MGLKVSKKKSRQILCLTCDRGTVSVANTLDNGRETAVKMDGWRLIKMGNHKKIFDGLETIDECFDALDKLDAEKSIFSDL